VQDRDVVTSDHW